LIDAIDTTSLLALRDRALIGLMVYTFARVGAAVSMNVEDYFVQGRRDWVRLHEKGGKEHEMPTHHNLGCYLEEYITAACISKERKDRFRTTVAAPVSGPAIPCFSSDVWRMIRRRAAAVGIKTRSAVTLSRHRHYGLSEEWRQAGKCPTDGCA
jgi:integrase/recombinase XerD